MDQKPKDWVQIAGNIGLIASLLFVGYQSKQDRKIAIAATFQDRASTTSETLAAYKEWAEE